MHWAKVAAAGFTSAEYYNVVADTRSTADFALTLENQFYYNNIIIKYCIIIHPVLC